MKKCGFYRLFIIFNLLCVLLSPITTFAATDFNPSYLISDEEMQDCSSWSKSDVQKFLEARGSYLANYSAPDNTGTIKTAAEIIYNSSVIYQINPKFLLVTLQKEQSLVTDDSPTQKQLDWATGYAVCDSCSMDDPKIQKHKGFFNQVENAAGIIRWYYDNNTKSFVKKKGVATTIDSQEVIPQSWATAFLYTYTPHLHGNKNFWRIWQTWFTQVYPDGTLMQSASSTEIYLVQNGTKRKFKNKTVLISRADPKMIITVPDVELNNYPTGTEISLPNYSILKTQSEKYYLLDYDTLRPFASYDVVKKIGYNPQEIIEVADSDLVGYTIGPAISNTSTPPQGIIYQITDLNNCYYLYKDSILYPIVDKNVINSNYKNLEIEKKKLKDINNLDIANTLINFQDGTLLKVEDRTGYYVIEKGKKRRIADQSTFVTLGYSPKNVITVSSLAAMNIPDGEQLFLNTSLLSSKDKFLGDSEAEVIDAYKSKLPAYLVAEYPSGKILSGKNIDTPRPIASLTKIMTAIEAVEQGYKMDKTITYDDKKYSAYGNTLKLVTGEKLKSKDIFNTMLIASVNNTARIVAQNCGLTETKFLSSLNERLSNWGADSTVLEDVTGLSEKNISTPRDLLKIFTKALSYKDIKASLGTTEYAFKEVLNKNKISSHSLKHTNQLIQTTGRNYRILASKTGYTEEAGAVLLMLIENRSNKKQYIVLTMGNSDYNNRFVEPNKIAEWILIKAKSLSTAKN